MADIDVSIGSRLRALRYARAMTLGQVADRIGVRPQQVQKYEMGVNRVGAARLFEFAQLFGVPISTFFEALQRSGVEQDLPTSRRAHLLAREFEQLSEPQKRAVLSLVRSLSNNADKKEQP